MRNLFLYIGILSLLFACQSNEDEPADIKDVYILKEVNYYLSEGDSVTTQQRIVGTGHLVNETDNSLKWDIYPFQEAMNYVVFDIDKLPDEEDFILKGDFLVSAPIQVSEEFIVRGREEWCFDLQSHKQERLYLQDENQQSNEIIVPGKSEMRFKASATYEVITTSFRALYIGEQTGKEVLIEGKYVGEIITSTGLEVVETPLTSKE